MNACAAAAGRETPPSGAEKPDLVMCRPDRQGLIQRNLRLAPYGVRRFLGRYRVPAVLGFDTEDLVSEALLAVCQAAASWNPDRGTFATYATTAIQNRLLNVCRLERGSSIGEVEFISLDTPVSELGDERLHDVLPDPRWVDSELVDSTSFVVREAVG